MSRNTLGTLILGTCLAFAGCDDSTFDLSPILTSDTVWLATPERPGNDTIPTALDVTSNGAGGLWGGRFPERVSDALAWDFLVRIRDGQMVLMPPGVLGLASRASITAAIPGETLEGLREAPGQSSFISDDVVPMQKGSVYVARSRDSADQFGGSCAQYAKLSPVEIDAAAGRVRIALTTNERCSDPRLVPE